jgi:hypothetical protein
MYEALLPSTQERVEVKGLTLKQLVELQSSVFMEHTNLYVVLTKLAKLVHQSIGTPIPFDDWLGTISDQDLHALVFALYRDTFGPDLQVTVTCPEKRTSVPIKINLDTQVTVSLSNNNPIDLTERQSIDIPIGTRTFSVTYRPTRALEDQLCVYNVTGLALDLSNMSKDELSLFSLRVPTVLQVSSDLGTFKRPPCTAPLARMRDWFMKLQEVLGNVPLSTLSVLEPKEPVSIDFQLKYPCPQCGDIHTESLNFFLYLLERLV